MIHRLAWLSPRPRSLTSSSPVPAAALVLQAALVLGAPLVLLAPAAAQVTEKSDAQQVIEVRVTSAQPHVTIIDRGTVDGLAKQDRIVLTTREGARYEGTVVRIGERAAVVELDDATYVPAAGTRGEVRVPRSRFDAPIRPAAPAQPAGQQPQSTPSPEHPPWERQGDDWTDKQPLLAKVRPLHPDERDPVTTGRVYTMTDFIAGSEGHTTDVFFRTGADVLYENIFGKGGDLHIDGEINYRNTKVPDDDDQSGTKLRLDRFSYTWGGNRFAPNRFEVGRFLQHEMPEFGVLDGIEWNRRLESGDSFGASTGFLPEPTPDQKTGRDLSFATWYRWVADESELLSMTAGYQKTFHNFNADRDLIVTKVVYLPADAWTFNGTAWIDLYGATDTAKGSGAEVTQAYVTLGRRWDSGSALRLTYTHLAFPDIERNEFTPVTLQQLADAHNDRASIFGRQAIGRSVAVFGQAGGWNDHVDEGGDAEAGLDVEDFLFDDTRVEIAGFGSNGRFSNALGWRASLNKFGAHTIWGLGYEFTLNNIDGFQTDNDDIPQHRAHLSWERHGDTGWSFSAYADVLLYDSENAVISGILLQRSF